MHFYEVSTKDYRTAIQKKSILCLQLCKQETACGLVKPKGSFSHRPTSPLGALYL